MPQLAKTLRSELRNDKSTSTSLREASAASNTLLTEGLQDCSSDSNYWKEPDNRSRRRSNEKYLENTQNLEKQSTVGSL